MKISRVNQNNQNFKARLCGDYKAVINIVKDAKVHNDAIKYYLQKMNNLVPNDNDRIFLFFRDMEANGHPYEEHFLRSQVEILRENDPFNLQELRERIYPFENEPKDLLKIMVEGIERILFKQQKDTHIPQIKYLTNEFWNGSILNKIENNDLANFDEKGVLIRDLLG